MKQHPTAAKVIALGLTSQAILGAEAPYDHSSDKSAGTTIKLDDKWFDYFAGEIKATIEASGVYGHMIIWNDGNNDDGIFVATNATNFPQGITNGTVSVALSDTEECNSDALDRALKFPLENEVKYEINELGMIEGDEGWFQQPIRELQGNSTLPVSLEELVTGSGSEYSLAVYLLSSDDELLGCASLKDLTLTEQAAEYDKILDGLRQDQEAIKGDPSSGSKIPLFVSVCAIAAVGIAAMLGDVLAL